jgi:hypothetical protein
MPRSFVDDIVEEGLWHNIYQCDTGRYFMSDDGPPEAWSMEWLSSTENGLLYEMGFRTDDYDLTIRRNAHGSTVYVLDSDGMVDAWNALKAYNSFVITFKRPVAPTGYHTYTMTLTLT